ncbi:DNA adenine methylase [Pseudomonas sp. HY7a-MNA-CIBAN-0227]|uniref:DNA adenine methylase n=1 Tax=Pseudomonas sp. HY7a-MNA-CIBAN-0227 TaxID=3140474 RepID=UPI00332819CA
MTRGLKPFVKWAGGKRDELEIINEFKPTSINRYIEPFVGGGAVYFDIEAKSYHINDKSINLIALYNAIKTGKQEFHETLFMLDGLWCNWTSARDNASIVMRQHIDDYRLDKIKRLEGKGVFDFSGYEESMVKAGIYNFARSMMNAQWKSASSKAAYYFFVLNYCYGGMNRYNAKGEFNVSYAASYNKKRMDLKYLFNEDLLNKLDGTVISNLSYEQIIDGYSDLNQDDFIFIDPPYDSVFKDYEASGFGEKDQRALGKLLFSLSCKWMVVISDTPLIREIYGVGARIVEYDKQYKTNINNSNSKQEVKHLIIMNY